MNKTTVTIEWISDEERIIPCVGVGKKGVVFTVPNSIGNSLIDQKLAKELKYSSAKEKGGK